MTNPDEKAPVYGLLTFSGNITVIEVPFGRS